MKKFIGVILLLVGWAAHPAVGADSAGTDKLTRMLQQSTLTLLKEGNLRYTDGKSFHPNLEATRRAELAAAGQEPLATILACSDSRGPVEIIFDRGLGDLLIVRVVGNVAGLSELATMEYGVTHLGTPVLVVLGHSQCDAVTAAVKGSELHGHLPSLISLIKPAAEKAKLAGTDDETIPRAIEFNVWQQIENIFTRSALIREAVAAGKVTVVGAVYNIVTGQVQWLGPHPEMSRLLADTKTTTAPGATITANSITPKTDSPSTPPVAKLPAVAKHVAPVSAPAPAHSDSVPPEPVTRAEVAAAHH